MNTKGSKVGKRVRSFVRWGVWVCTALLVIGVVGSNWIGVLGEVSYEYADEDQTMAWVNLEVYRTRMTVEYHPRQRQHWGGEPNPGLRFAGHRIEYSLAVFESPWWVGLRRWQGGSGLGGYRGWGVPLVYPAAVMVAWSVWLMPFWKWWKRVGLDGVVCSSCGYSLEGLSGGVCPECGDAYGEA